MEIKKRRLFRNPTYNKISSIPISSQILFWIGYFTFNTIRWGSFYSDYAYSFKSNLIEFPFHIALSYIFIFYLLPKLFNGKVIDFFTLLVISLGLALVLKFLVAYYFTSGDVMPEYAGITSTLNLAYATSYLLGQIYVIGFVTAIKLAIDWIKQKEYLTETNEMLLENELKYLRSQIQPHFFFNTLNNLYSLTIDKSDKAPDLILKLSDLMKYFLYETGKEFQTLENEISHIKDYIEIEKLRYDENLKVNFNINSKTKKVIVKPLILIPLVENAFKHGARNSKKNGYITIDLNATSNLLDFRIENSFEKPTKKIKAQIGGIGLTNLKKRLDLNYGPDFFNLDIIKEKNKYIAHLKIKL
ncbi:MAG: sensor histidine kinase [Flavobacteriales bacterium]|jgi:two-component system LytT family sensor kinase|tara:strand:+ start:4454 stop:5527 length:1074 start_codon:yes stop_codon:yes gene_type:complete